MAEKKIYNLNQIEGACIIGSPIVAGILIAHNYRAMGERQKGTLWIIIGIVWTAALRLIIPIQNWNTPQLLAEAKYCKERLNNFGFRHPFRLLLVDNSGIELKEKEIE